MNDTQKEGYRSRNHYGRTYTLMKVENHQQNVTIAKLQAQIEYHQINFIRTAIIVFAFGCIVGGFVAIAIEKGVGQ